MLQNDVACVQGVISTGVGLSLGPAAEDMKKAILCLWDGTTQNGVEETLPNARYTFKIAAGGSCSGKTAYREQTLVIKNHVHQVPGTIPRESGITAKIHQD